MWFANIFFQSIACHLLERVFHRAKTLSKSSFSIFFFNGLFSGVISKILYQALGDRNWDKPVYQYGENWHFSYGESSNSWTCLYINLDLWFFSSLYCSFLQRSLACICQLSIILFWETTYGTVFLILMSVCSLLSMEIQLNFKIWSLVLPLAEIIC